MKGEYPDLPCYVPTCSKRKVKIEEELVQASSVTLDESTEIKEEDDSRIEQTQAPPVTQEEFHEVKEEDNPLKTEEGTNKLEHPVTQDEFREDESNPEPMEVDSNKAVESVEKAQHSQEDPVSVHNDVAVMEVKNCEKDESKKEDVSKNVNTKEDLEKTDGANNLIQVREDDIGEEPGLPQIFQDAADLHQKIFREAREVGLDLQEDGNRPVEFLTREEAVQGLQGLVKLLMAKKNEFDSEVRAAEAAPSSSVISTSAVNGGLEPVKVEQPESVMPSTKVPGEEKDSLETKTDVVRVYSSGDTSGKLYLKRIQSVTDSKRQAKIVK